MFSFLLIFLFQFNTLLYENIVASAKTFFIQKGIDSIVVEIRSTTTFPNVSNSHIRFSPHWKKGNSTIVFDIVKENIVRQKILVFVNVKTFENVFKPNAMLSKHEVLTPEKLYIECIETTHIDDPLTNGKSIATKRAKRIIQKENYLKESSIETIPDVMQNETVHIIVSKGNIAITTKGIAKADGYVGNKIPVQPVGSYEKILATIIGVNYVRVD